jgi:C_GCAxxG_C_C family probable redox protein
MINPIRTAKDRFALGFNCAQAVFSAFASHSLISDETALKITSMFGGGIGRQGEVCGALTGALLALGLERGRADPDSKELDYQLAEKFMTGFKQQHGTILCRELIGHDISSKEGLKAAKESQAFKNICPMIVERTAEELDRFLSESVI